jgi:hypothetical protein
VVGGSGNNGGGGKKFILLSTVKILFSIVVSMVLMPLSP